MIDYIISGILHVQPASSPSDIIYVQTRSRLSNIVLKSTIETLVNHTDCRI
jgi:hypothetical protein